MGLDKRGISRGKCKCQSCDCGEYEVAPGSTGHHCNYCEHPAPAHEMILVPEPDVEEITRGLRVSRLLRCCGLSPEAGADG